MNVLLFVAHRMRDFPELPLIASLLAQKMDAASVDAAVGNTDNKEARKLPPTSTHTYTHAHTCFYYMLSGLVLVGEPTSLLREGKEAKTQKLASPEPQVMW